jgi:hypothetical protein
VLGRIRRLQRLDSAPHRQQALSPANQVFLVTGLDPQGAIDVFEGLRRRVERRRDMARGHPTGGESRIAGIQVPACGSRGLPLARPHEAQHLSVLGNGGSVKHGG